MLLVFGLFFQVMVCFVAQKSKIKSWAKYLGNPSFQLDAKFELCVFCEPVMSIHAWLCNSNQYSFENGNLYWLQIANIISEYWALNLK